MAFSNEQTTPLAPLEGRQVIETVLATLPFSPGVYRMLDAKGDALYVGKARSLRKRVYAYTQVAKLPDRLKRMVFETRHLEVITTASEAEALLLEANLISGFGRATTSCSATTSPIPGSSSRKIILFPRSPSTAGSAARAPPTGAPSPPPGR